MAAPRQEPQSPADRKVAEATVRRMIATRARRGAKAAP